jgi:transposase
MSENNQEIIIVGVDVAKDKLDLAFAKDDLITIENNETGFKKLFKNLTNPGNLCFVMEATGGYEKAFVSFLLAKEIKVAVVNAKRVRDFAKSMGAYAKSDRIDADMIRYYAQTVYAKGRLQLREPRSVVEQRIEALLKRRHQLVEQKTIEQQHLESAGDKVAVRSIKRIIKLLDGEIAGIEAKMISDINDDEELKQKMNRLLTVKGIGMVSAVTLISLLPELGNVSNKEIAALVGVAPFSKDSGKKNGKRTIFGGRALIRSTLYMAILSAIRFNKPIKIFYQRLIANGKLKKVALTACMRKLLVILNSISKQQSEWNPDFANLA